MKAEIDPAAAEATFRVAAEELRGFVGRVERLMDEAKQVKEGLAVVFKEAEGRGYDAGLIKQVVKLRAMDADKRAAARKQRDDQEALLDTYLNAVGDGG